MTAAVEGIDSDRAVMHPVGHGLNHSAFAQKTIDSRLGAVDGEPCSPASV